MESEPCLRLWRILFRLGEEITRSLGLQIGLESMLTSVRARVTLLAKRSVMIRTKYEPFGTK